MLRDRVVMGMKYKAARAQMFREKVANLNEAVHMLRASEVAAQHIKEIEQGSTSDEVVSLCIVLHILDTILVHCILHILGTILVHCLI